MVEYIYQDFDVETDIETIRRTIDELEKSYNNATQIVASIYGKELLTERSRENSISYEAYSTKSEGSTGRANFVFDESVERSGSIESIESINNTLKENFNEYESDEENLPIPARAISDLQRVRYSYASIGRRYGAQI